MKSQRRKRFRLPQYRLDRRETLLCLLSSVLLTLSYDPFRLGFLAYVALVPLFAVLLRGGRRDSKRRAIQAAYLTGFVHFVTLMYWISKLTPSASFTVRWLLWPGVFLIAAYLSLYFGLFGLLTGIARERFGIRRALLLVPLFWGIQEWLRTHGTLAFPWGVLSYALCYSPKMIQGAAAFGHLGVSYILAIANALFLGILRPGPLNSRIFLASVLVVMIGGNWAYGNWVMEHTRIEASRKSQITVMQPNIDLARKWDPEYLGPTFALIDSMSEASAGPDAKLLIWPETSAPLYLLHAEPLLQRLQYLCLRANIDLVIGFPHYEKKGDAEPDIYNAATLIQQSGPKEFYAKMHLLPFGEHIPFSDRIRLLQKVDFGEADFKSGETPVVFESRAGRFGILICFEATFNEPSRSFVQNGSDFLVNITNDGWFGGTPGPYQHGIMAVYRAVENGTWLFRSANSGISMIVDPFGRVVQDLGENVRGHLSHTIDYERRPTFYGRHGNLAYGLLILGNLLLFALSALARFLRIPVS